jgi:hypothetical protein
LRLARTDFAWLAAATNVVVSLPRIFVYDVSFLVVGMAATRRPTRVQ